MKILMMPVYGKDKNNESYRENPLRKGKMNSEFGRGGELSTILGKGTVVLGDIKVQNSLRIDGHVKGNVKTTDTVIIGKGGSVEGQISSKHVFLAGSVQGDIIASGKVFLEATSSVMGDVKASRLVIDEGAVFDGKCNMKDVEKFQESKKAEEPKV
jgi:cytoskeletal protein CcmA (bactofilin family)